MRGRAFGRARADLIARTGSRHCFGGVAGAAMYRGLPKPARDQAFRAHEQAFLANDQVFLDRDQAFLTRDQAFLARD